MLTSVSSSALGKIVWTPWILLCSEQTDDEGRGDPHAQSFLPRVLVRISLRWRDHSIHRVQGHVSPPKDRPFPSSHSILGTNNTRERSAGRKRNGV